MLLQIASLAGAFLILLSYFALQRGVWSSHAWPYLWSNFIGAALLTGIAVADRRLGFIVLEAAWALVTVHAMVTRAKPHRPPA